MIAETVTVTIHIPAGHDLRPDLLEAHVEITADNSPLGIEPQTLLLSIDGAKRLLTILDSIPILDS